jgi:hypothetical protein
VGAGQEGAAREALGRLPVAFEVRCG